VTAGFETVLQNLKWWRDNAGVLVLPAFYEMLARAQFVLGRRGDAVTSVDAAIDLSNRFGEQLFAAELYRRRGDLLSGSGSRDAEAQEACFEKALAIARDQSSRTMELRAANSLARLWTDQGEYQKAQDMLAPLYGWFTEGFDTADLKDAKALLEELS
jgi:predicted ATPase